MIFIFCSFTAEHLAGRLWFGWVGEGSADADGEAGHGVAEAFVVGDQKYTPVHKRGSM